MNDVSVVGQEINQEKVREVNRRVQKHAAILNQFVDSLVNRYLQDLSAYIDKVKVMIERDSDLTDIELEQMTLRIPVYLYYASGGLEKLGVEGESAKAVRMEVFNTIYVELRGTIQDKTKGAELATFPEYLVEVAFARAYKKLKLQIEMAEHIFTGVRRVLAKRITDIEVGKLERQGSFDRNKPMREREVDRD